MSVLSNPGRYYSTSGSTPLRHNYAVNAYFPSRKLRPYNLKGHGNFRKDIKDTVQHAALINIVAAVNEDLVDKQEELRKGSASTYSSSRSNASSYSITGFPHDKSVSIPRKKQRDFSVPEEVVRRKPVYYKHSKDLEVLNQSHQIRLFEDGEAYNFKVKLSKKMEKEKSFVEKENKTKPMTAENKVDGTKKVSKGEEKTDKTPRDGESRISSAVRRLGTLKRSKPRQVHELHKCEAIDLLDKSIDVEDPAKTALNDSRKLIPCNQMSRIPYIRTKSLPVMFPTKTSTKTSTSVSSAGHQKQPLILTDRPLSKSLRQRTPDSMYRRMSNLPGGFGYGEMSINNGINEAPDITAPLVHDSSKIPKVSAMMSQRLKRMRNAKSPRSPVFGREISLMSTNTEQENEEIRHSRRIASQSNLYKSKRALHEAVKRVLNGRTLVCETSISRKLPIEERKESNKFKRTFALTRTILAGLTDKTSKVFQGNSSDSSLDGSDVDVTIHETVTSEMAEGGSNILKNQTHSVRSFSPGIQPMSSRELLRLEQKILPVNEQELVTIDNHTYLTTSSGMNLQQNASDASIQMNSNGNNDCEDDKVESNECNKSVASDDDERTFVDTKSEGDDDDINILETKNRSEYYKLVKAIDNDPYIGYEHKKLRRSASTAKSKEAEAIKAQYVKVKLS